MLGNVAVMCWAKRSSVCVRAGARVRACFSK